MVEIEIVCNACGDSWLGQQTPEYNAKGKSIGLSCPPFGTQKEAKVFARSIGYRNDIQHGWGLLCRSCYQQRATL